MTKAARKTRAGAKARPRVPTRPTPAKSPKGSPKGKKTKAVPVAASRAALTSAKAAPKKAAPEKAANGSAGAKRRASTQAVPGKRVAGTAHAERFERQAFELPVMELGEAIDLAKSLAAAKPTGATPAITEELRHVAAALARAEAVRERHGDDTPSTSARSYDVAMDRAWATFVRRIQDHVELPAQHHGHAPDAVQIYRIVRDLSILKLNYLAEFAQIGARLDAMKREGLFEAARSLAGSEFVDEVLRCHADYGRALGVMGPSSEDAAHAHDCGEARNALIDALAEYTVQVLALARAGRPESWAAVSESLAPIVHLRTRVASRQRPREAPRAVSEHPPVGDGRVSAGSP